MEHEEYAGSTRNFDKLTAWRTNIAKESNRKWILTTKVEKLPQKKEKKKKVEVKIM